MAIEYICTDGTNILPLIIFKGENFVSSVERELECSVERCMVKY
jgi:hypothetical protein